MRKLFTPLSFVLALTIMMPTYASADLVLRGSGGEISVPEQIKLRFIGDHVKGKIQPGHMQISFSSSEHPDKLNAFVEISAGTKLMFNCEKKVPMIASIDSDGLLKLSMAAGAPNNVCQMSFTGLDPKTKKGRYSLFDKPGDILPD